MLHQLKNDIQKGADPKRAVLVAKYFKSGKGEYAEGDVFLGLTNPQARLLVKKYKGLALTDCLKLLHSKIHEERLIALLILVYQFSKGDKAVQKKIYDIYLANTKYINNWDLVDLSAPNIVGNYLVDEIASSPKAPRNDKLVKLARSENLWEKRIAMLATAAFIRNGEYKEVFVIADILLHDTHDLIHKAVGWMLREVGKLVSEKALEDYLRPRYKTMPRTMLRYTIERFDEKKRKQYLAGII